LYHKTVVLRSLILGFILMMWEFSSSYIPQTFIAPPSKVFPLLLAIWINTDFLGHLYVTFIAILLTFGLAAVSGLLLGFALGVWKLLRDAYEPILSMFYAVPTVVW
jgi:ABC-type nitrate/sulfonate/bicarbonate transport system permease component